MQAEEMLPVRPVSVTPGLDAYRELLELQDTLDEYVKELDDVDEDIQAMHARRTEIVARLNKLPAKAASLKERIISRIDGIVGVFGSGSQ